MLSNINVKNAQVTGSGIEVNIAASVFNAATPVNFSFTGPVGNAGTHQSVSDDYIHGAREAFGVGYSGGGTTAATWNIKVAGANFLELYTHGATNTTTVNISGAGSVTLFGVSSEFANVTTFSDTATGAQIITGALQTDGSSKPYTGFLTDDMALASINVVGNANNIVDLSGFGTLPATVNIHNGDVVLDAALLTSGATLSLGSPSIIGWGGDLGDGAGAGGTINWLAVTTTANELLFWHGVSGSAGLTINNATANFTVNFQDEDFHKNAIVINGPTTGANTLTLDVGSAQTNEVATGLSHGFTMNGYSTVNLNIPVADAAFTDLGGNFLISPNSGSATLTITGGALGDGLALGNHGGFLGYPNPFGDVGTPTVTTDGGTITDNFKGYLYLGYTDATVINAGSGGGISIDGPPTDFLFLVTETGSSGPGIHNELEGSLGPVTPLFDFTDPVELDVVYDQKSETENPVYLFGPNGGPTNMTGGSDGGDRFFDTLGKETINLNNAAGTDDIFYGAFNVDEGPADPRFFDDGKFDTGVLAVINPNRADSDFGDFLTGNAYNSHGALVLNKITTIKGFVAGSSGDVIHFQDGSWADTWHSIYPNLDLSAGGFFGQGQLVSGDLSTFPDGRAIIFDTGTGTPTNPMPGNADLIVDQFQAYANAGALAADLASSKNGHYLEFANSTTSTEIGSFNILVAYQNTSGGVNIADVELIVEPPGFKYPTVTIAADAFSYQFKVVASDLISLTGVSLSSLASHNVHFDLV